MHRKILYISIVMLVFRMLLHIKHKSQTEETQATFNKNKAIANTSVYNAAPSCLANYFTCIKQQSCNNSLYWIFVVTLWHFITYPLSLLVCPLSCSYCVVHLDWLCDIMETHLLVWFVFLTLCILNGLLCEWIIVCIKPKWLF